MIARVSSQQLRSLEPSVCAQRVVFIGSQLWFAPSPPDGIDIGARIEGYRESAAGEDATPARAALVHSRGLLLTGTDGSHVNVRQLRLEDGRVIRASEFEKQKFLKSASASAPADDKEKELRDLSDAEKAAIEKLRDACAGILGVERAAIRPTTHLFRAGLASMDVVRLIEEVRERCGGTELAVDDVYGAPLFSELSTRLVHRFASNLNYMYYE